MLYVLITSEIARIVYLTNGKIYNEKHEIYFIIGGNMSQAIEHPWDPNGVQRLPRESGWHQANTNKVCSMLKNIDGQVKNEINLHLNDIASHLKCWRKQDEHTPSRKQQRLALIEVRKVIKSLEHRVEGLPIPSKKALRDAISLVYFTHTFDDNLEDGITQFEAILSWLNVLRGRAIKLQKKELSGIDDCLVKSIDEAIAKIWNLDHASQGELIDVLSCHSFTYQFSEDPVNGSISLDSFLLRLAHIAWCINIRIEEFNHQGGPNTDLTLLHMVKLLCDLYKEVTGKKPTHNPYNKTYYDGEIYSEADRFVNEFFKQMKASVKPHTIGNAMAKVVHS